MESTREMLLPRPAVDPTQQQPDSEPCDHFDEARIAVESQQDQDAQQPAKNFTNVYASDPHLAVPPDNSIRAKLRRALSTHRFQVFIVCFVIVDCMIVIAELLMDLRILGMIEEAGSRGRTPTKAAIEAQYLIPDVLHSISIAVLAMFLLEMLVKIIAFGLTFFRLFWEIFDLAVIIVTFVLDVMMQHSHSSTNGLGLLIILRLWRVARVLNGMVRSVKTQAVRHVECEKRRREALEEEMLKYREMCRHQKHVIAELENLLKTHDIPLPLALSPVECK